MDEHVTVTVREWRQEVGISQSQLGALISTSQRAVSNIESQTLLTLTMSTLTRRAAAMRCGLFACAVWADRFRIILDPEPAPVTPFATLRSLRIEAGYSTQETLFQTGRFSHFSRISQIELAELHQQRVRSLQDYLGVLGAELALVVVLPDGRVKVLSD